MFFAIEQTILEGFRGRTGRNLHVNFFFKSGIILLRHSGRERHEWDTTENVSKETIYLVQEHNGIFSTLLYREAKSQQDALQEQKCFSELDHSGGSCQDDGVHIYTPWGRKNANDRLKDPSLFQNNFYLNHHSLHQQLPWQMFTMYLDLDGFTIYISEFLSGLKTVRSILLIQTENRQCPVVLKGKFNH